MAADPQVESASNGAAFAVGIVGAGVMGAGIAQVAALACHPVHIYDAQPGAATAAIGRIAAALRELAQKQKIAANRAMAAAQRLTVANSIDELADCGLIIEAIVEDLEAKRALFRAMERIAGPTTLFATNTSSLSITAIAAALEHPQRLAGMHFFNPAPEMPLVEVVQGAATAPEIVKKLHELAQRWGKTPVIARSTPGFIVNRVARPFYAEALRVLEERGADCATVDAVMQECGGFRMGPFELMDLIGNDVNHAVTRSVFDAFYGDPRFRPSTLQLELVQAGHLGRKSGRGFYAYQAGKPIATPSTAPLHLAPSRIQIYGDTPLAHALAVRLSASGARFERATAHADGRVAGWNDGALYRTDGRAATARAAAAGMRNTILMDLACDDSTATRAAVAAADQAHPDALHGAIGLLQAAGYAVSVIDDLPGMIVLRTVAMLANIAADAISEGVCSVADLDLAMRRGVNYPRGPLAWADEIGIGAVVQALDHLAAAYGAGRYHASQLLRRKALTNSNFTGRETPRAAPAERNATYETVRG